MGEATNKVSRTYLITHEIVTLLEQMAKADNRTYSSEIEWLIKAEYKRRDGNGTPVPGSAPADGGGSGGVGDD